MATVHKRWWKRAGGQVETAWIVDFSDASGNRDRKQFSSKPEADAFRIKIEGEFGTGAYRPDAAKVTVKLAELHADDAKKHPEPPARFNWHALRHFAVSCWIEAGLAPKTVQTFAGHSSLQVTMDRYGHLFKSGDHQRAMDAIARQMFAGG